MTGEDRSELRTLWGATAAIGAAMVLATLYLVVAAFWDARDLDSTIGEVLGTRDVDAASGPRPELLVAYETAGGDTMMFAEPIGYLAPEVGDRVLVWYSDAATPRALVARQRFAWPALLAPAGLVLSAFGVWRLRLARRRDELPTEVFDPEDL